MPKLLFIFFWVININSFGQNYLDLQDKLRPVGPENILKSPDYYTWGSSVVQGNDGKYYMFYNRWLHGVRPLDDDSLNYIFNGFSGWLKYGEIACGVSDNLEGPYKYVATVLKSTGQEGRWDRFTMTNPHIEKFGDYYYLYYVSTNFDSGYVSKNGTKNKEELQWMRYNCAQSIGVIKVKSINDFLIGNFQYPKQPIVKVDNVRTFEVANNPSVTQGPDGRYYMMYKSRKPGGHMTFWFAVADRPDASFTTISNVTSEADMASEDPCMWYDKRRNRFYAVAKYFSNSKNYGLQFGSLILIESKDGKVWQLAKHPEVSKRELLFKSGKKEMLARLERPFIYLDKNGTPLALFAAASFEPPGGGDPLQVPDEKNTFNVCIPLKR